MKKKVSIREQREQMAAQARQVHQKKEAVRQEAVRAVKEAEEAAAREKERLRQEALRAERIAEMNKHLNPVRQRTLSAEKKSSAKAAGLKSTFIMGGDDLLMTSFGKGNAAVVEKKVSGKNIVNLAPKPAFTASAENDVMFRIDGRVHGASADNPLHHAEEKPKTREDLIHARAALEKLYYDGNFEDNIHIQAVHSVLDVEKILTIHINNIVYMLNNFLRNDDGLDLVDLVGLLNGEGMVYENFIKTEGKKKWMVEEFHKLCTNKRLGYLNLEVLPMEPPKDKSGKPIKRKVDPNTIKVTEEEFFYMLAAISEMRQMLVHGSPTQNIYKVDGFGKGNKISGVLDRLYQDRVHELNSGFIDKAGKNLAILFKAFSVKEKEEKAAYVQDYYDFTVRKEYKNTGFSIKLLREHMTAEIEEAMVLRDKKYDSVRGKLYPFADYAIFRYYRGHKDEAEDLVGSLRASFSEVEKDKVYSREAARIWEKKEIGELILGHILPEMSGDSIKNLSPDKDVTPEMLQEVLITAEATDFSKMIYMLTLFINGKEINDLLTTLIHQFENIAAFTSVMKDQGLRTGFAKGFQLFNRSGQVAEELRTINSFARMTKEASFAKEPMYVEAFRVLGMKETDEEKLIQEVKDLLDVEKSGKGTQRRGVRNFIANNVIESVRFKYLIRYGNVNKLKELAKSPVLISFVLKDIPDDQIKRYFIDLGENGETDMEVMRESLTRRLTGFSFEDIRDVRQNDKGANQEEQKAKQQKQALVRLYLTVLYLALKNLVYINSRYFLAFHCVERDRKLLNPDFWKEANKENNKYSAEYAYPAFAKWFLEQYPQKKRVAAYMNQNFANADDWAVLKYRNMIEHLDAIRNADRYIKDVKEIHSWFALYHYIMQRRIMEQFEYEKEQDSSIGQGKMISEEQLKPKTKEYFRKVEIYGSYCKDFVKALNVPFAYNLPRYKNLSIDELFDKNKHGEKGAGKKLENDE